MSQENSGQSGNTQASQQNPLTQHGAGSGFSGFSQSQAGYQEGSQFDYPLSQSTQQQQMVNNIYLVVYLSYMKPWPFMLFRTINIFYIF